jgi:hypothetical protein
MRAANACWNSSVLCAARAVEPMMAWTVVSVFWRGKANGRHQ